MRVSYGTRWRARGDYSPLYSPQAAVNAKALAIMRCQDDINTEHNMESICPAAVAQWTKRLTRNGQTRVRNWKGANILLLQQRPHELEPVAVCVSLF